MHELSKLRVERLHRLFAKTRKSWQVHQELDVGDFLHKREGGSGDKYHASMLCLNLSSKACTLRYVFVAMPDEALFHNKNQFSSFVLFKGVEDPQSFNLNQLNYRSYSTIDLHFDTGVSLL